MAELIFDDPDVAPRIAEWTSERYDEPTRREVQALIDAGDTRELADRFYRTLEFGTGGLRGKLGAGTNRMNAYVVARATQGLATYVKEHAEKPGPLRAAVAHDCRNRSREFAETVASVLAANGFVVYISPELRPTPYLSTCLRLLDCHTGVMVTASHNPKEYNGYKVYWDDGSQVIPPHDEGIINEVDKVTDDSMVNRIRFEDGVANGSIKVMGPEMDRAYLDAVLLQRYDEELIRKHGPRIVYTPLHGVGGTMAVRALNEWGFADVIPEPEQMKPNGDFPTAKSPNPEEAVALERAVALARKEDADLVLATDPDADRLGIAVKHGGDYHLVNGNQLCALLCEHILRHGAAMGKLPAKPGVVTTIVTSPLVQKIALANGAECPLVLTGFKWIAEQVRQWIREESGVEFVYGTEESYGFLIGQHCRDKDGIVACCVVAEMAALARSRGRTLIDELHDIYRRYGVHHEWTISVGMPGVEGAARIQAILDGVRRNPPKEVGGRKVVRTTRVDLNEVHENGQVRPLGLPLADVFIFDMEDGSRAIVRPSGTEPKIKFYMFLRDGAPCGSLDEVRAKLKDFAGRTAVFQKEFLAAIGCND